MVKILKIYENISFFINLVTVNVFIVFKNLLKNVIIQYKQ
jgi:hypothetical protein